MLMRVDPSAVRPSGSTPTDFGSADVALGHGSVWVSNAGGSSVQRFDPTTFEEGPLRPEWTVGRAPRGIAVTEDAVWVAISGEDVVARIDPSARSTSTIPVATGPRTWWSGPATSGSRIGWTERCPGSTLRRTRS